MEAYCHYPISEAKELLYSTRLGYALTQAAASTSKYATAMYISTNQSQVVPATPLAHDSVPKTYLSQAQLVSKSRSQIQPI